MIVVNEPDLGGNEADYVLECLKTGWISSGGHFVEQFEQAWAEYCGMTYGVAVCNGTTALEAALASLDLKPGDEVIMPTFTIISCALAVVEQQAVPVLVDCDPETWCMDASAVEEKITPRTRAIMTVHIYGHPVDMGPIIELADQYHLAIVEDAAEAHGAEYKGKRCGGLGDLSCFSFYANKIITTGEGGMVLCRDRNLAEKLKGERNLFFQADRRYLHDRLGHNYRMTNIQAAIGLAQVDQIDKHLAHKRWMADAYQERLGDLPGLQLPVEKPWAKNVYWMYGLVISEDTGMDARRMSEKLRAEGVETRAFFLGMHEQPALRRRGLFLNERHPVTERISRQGLYLPSGLTLTEEQVDVVCQAVRKCLK
jgi:perosamine synthetase